MYGLIRKRESIPTPEPELKVIGVSELKKGEVAIHINHDWGRGVDTISTPHTVVLYTEDGVLKTKRFEGKWTLAQVKNWKSLEKEENNGTILQSC